MFQANRLISNQLARAGYGLWDSEKPVPQTSYLAIPGHQAREM